MKSAIVVATSLLGTVPTVAQAQINPIPVTQIQTPPPPAALPSTVQPGPVPLPTIYVPRDWRGVFDAIDAGNWAGASVAIATLPPGPLTALAKAELYTAKRSPTVDLASIQSLLAEAPELPQASQLAAMAVKRGALTTPPIMQQRSMINLGSAPGRYRATPVTGDPVADQLRPILDPLIQNNDPAAAEAQMLLYAPSMSVEARAEAAQRVAFSYYMQGLDLDARRVADTWRQGAAGEWASQAAWIAGLASWRLGDYNSASRNFQQAAQFATQRELRAGGYYWASRSEQAAGRPRGVTPFLRLAATSAESFYGLIALESLGLNTRLQEDPHLGFDPPIKHLPNVQRATELVRIGRTTLADELLRHQAKIGLSTEHHALIQVAKSLDLPAAQLWLANNGQRGARADAADRYPNPRWQPRGGWRVDPALAFGHIVQESSFRHAVISPAGAVGLMQVRPGTAGDIARKRGTAVGSLTDPATNLEYGQSFIEMMRGNSYTGGQLPRVIASYNAGPLPVGRWSTIYDKGDPLLWIESLPYWETRYYVPAVLRNMWVYQGLNGDTATTLKDMVQHRWPAFPTGMTRLAH